MKKADLWRAGTHLHKSGMILIARNYISYLNSSLSKTQSQILVFSTLCKC